MKTERTQIHFLSDVLVADASLDLEVPITYQTKWFRRRNKGYKQEEFLK